MIHINTKSNTMDHYYYVCNICDKSFKKKSHLNRHSIVHADCPSFQCQSCGKQFRRKQCLKSHMHMHKKVYTCLRPDCRQTGMTKNNFRHHTEMHLVEDAYLQCKICGQKFSTKDETIQHLRYEHNLSEFLAKNIMNEDFLCEFCGQRYVSSRLLQRHMYIHKNKSKSKCPYCKRTYNTRYLILHIKKRHPKNYLSLTTYPDPKDLSENSNVNSEGNHFNISKLPPLPQNATMPIRIPIPQTNLSIKIEPCEVNMAHTQQISPVNTETLDPSLRFQIPDINLAMKEGSPEYIVEYCIADNITMFQQYQVPVLRLDNQQSQICNTLTFYM